MFGEKLLHIKAAFKKMLLISMAPIALASCTAISTGDNRAEPEIFRVGELEVRLYSNRQRMMSSLPPFLVLLAGTRVGNDQIQISGYYDQENKRIYAINDAKTVIHEFKHYLEPEWKHDGEPQETTQSSKLTAVRSLPIRGAVPSIRAGSGQAVTDNASEF